MTANSYDQYLITIETAAADIHRIRREGRARLVRPPQRGVSVDMDARYPDAAFEYDLLITTDRPGAPGKFKLVEVVTC